MLRVGVIGLGVGWRHAEIFSANAKCELKTICDFDAEKLAKASAVFPRAKLETQAEAVLTDPEIDVVSIASYDNCHCEQILMGIDHGQFLNRADS